MAWPAAGEYQPDAGENLFTPFAYSFWGDVAVPLCRLGTRPPASLHRNREKAHNRRSQ